MRFNLVSKTEITNRYDLIYCLYDLRSDSTPLYPSPQSYFYQDDIRLDKRETWKRGRSQGKFHTTKSVDAIVQSSKYLYLEYPNLRGYVKIYTLSGASLGKICFEEKTVRYEEPSSICSSCVII